MYGCCAFLTCTWQSIRFSWARCPPPPAYPSPSPPPHSSIVLLQSCSNNPTGVDPSPEQWTVLFDIIKERRLLPFLDCAYQGFARYLPFRAVGTGQGVAAMVDVVDVLFAP
jgi:hypothetical protein